MSVLRNSWKVSPFFFFLSILENNVAKVISQDTNQALAGIDKRLGELQAELLKLASTKSDYEDVTDEIY